MEKPGPVIRKIIHKHFNYKKNQKFSMTEREFSAKISRIRSEIGDHGYGSELLSYYLPDLERRWTKIEDDVSPPILDRSPPSPVSNPKESKADTDIPLDGYDIFRFKEKPKFRWKGEIP